MYIYLSEPLEAYLIIDKEGYIKINKSFKHFGYKYLSLFLK